MNTPTQDQARPEQSSAAALPGTISPSDAARILADRRTALRQEAATKDQQEPSEAPAEEIVDEQPPVTEDSDDGDGQQVATDTDDTENPDSQDEQPEEGDEGGIEAVLLDGEEVPLSQIKDWREGSMRQEDYSRKTQVLAQQTQSITEMESRINSFAHAMNRQFMQQQQDASAGLQRYSKIDWVKLAQADPAKYTAAKAAFDAEQTAFQRKQGEWNGFLQEFDALGKETLTMRAQAALPEIKARIKNWGDGTYAELSDFVVDKYGFTRDMVNKITDPPFWEMANDAATYRKGKQVKTVPAKVIRRPKITTRTTAGVSRAKEQSKAVASNLEKARSLSGSNQMAAVAAALRARRNPG